MLVPSTVVKDVEPPSWGGVRNHHAAVITAMLVTTLTTARIHASLGAREGGADEVHAACSGAVGETTEVIALYSAATTVSCVAPAAVACGAVVLQVTLPAVLVQLYQDPPEASCTLTVLVVVGAIVNATWSRFVGVVEFRV